MGQTFASASNWVEVFFACTATFIQASAAFTAGWIPLGTAGALIYGVCISEVIELLTGRWDSKTLASAHGRVPNVVRWAGLQVACAFASLSVPVIRVVKTSLWSAFIFTSNHVEGVNVAIFGARSSKGATTRATGFVEVSTSWTLMAVNINAEFHVPSLTNRSLFKRMKASTIAGRWVKEIRDSVNFGALSILMLASASLSVKLKAAGTDLNQTLAVIRLEAVVVANWALTMIGQAVANSGVPVEALLVARLVWLAKALACNVVKVFCSGCTARVGRVFNALTRLAQDVIYGVGHNLRAV